MAIVYFPSLDSCEVVEAEFLEPSGSTVIMRLLVDSGFTGHSSFVLSDGARSLAQAAAAPSQTAGALTGMQQRVIVTCRIPALSFQRSQIAILTDLSVLDLPPGVQGLAGLRFLRNFRSWGAKQSPGKGWKFFLLAVTQ